MKLLVAICAAVLIISGGAKAQVAFHTGDSCGNGAHGTSTIACATSVTPVGTNFVYLVVVATEAISGAGSYTTVTSISSSGGLTYTLRHQWQIHWGSSPSDWLDVEEWYAVSATVVTELPTVNLSGSPDASALALAIYSGVNQTYPFDPNNSLPAGPTTSLASSTPSQAGVSTTESATALLGIAAQSSVAGCGSGITAGTGYTNSSQGIQNTGTNSACIAQQYQIVSAAQSNVTVAWGSAWSANLAAADAICAASNASCAPPPGTPDASDQTIFRLQYPAWRRTIESVWAQLWPWLTAVMEWWDEIPAGVAFTLTVIGAWRRHQRRRVTRFLELAERTPQLRLSHMTPMPNFMNTPQRDGVKVKGIER